MQAAQDGAEQRTASDRAALLLDALENESPVTTITVTIASNRKALPESWYSALRRADDIQINDQPISDAAYLLACVQRHPPHVVLLDKALLDELNPSSLRSVREQCPNMRVLLVWNEICPGLVAYVLRYRFQGLLLTTCRPEIVHKAIRAVCKGELWLSRESLAIVITDLLGLSDPEGGAASPDALRIKASEVLTPRELQVVELLRRGCINKEIARELGIMEDTVKKHLQSVFAKLGVHRRALVALRQLPGEGVAHPIAHTHRVQTRDAIATEQSAQSHRASGCSTAGFRSG